MCFIIWQRTCNLFFQNYNNDHMWIICFLFICFGLKEQFQILQMAFVHVTPAQFDITPTIQTERPQTHPQQLPLISLHL